MLAFARAMRSNDRRKLFVSLRDDIMDDRSAFSRYSSLSIVPSPRNTMKRIQKTLPHPRFQYFPAPLCCSSLPCRRRQYEALLMEKQWRSSLRLVRVVAQARHILAIRKRRLKAHKLEDSSAASCYGAPRSSDRKPARPKLRHQTRESDLEPPSTPGNLPPRRSSAQATSARSARAFLYPIRRRAETSETRMPSSPESKGYAARIKSSDEEGSQSPSCAETGTVRIPLRPPRKTSCQLYPCPTLRASELMETWFMEGCC